MKNFFTTIFAVLIAFVIFAGALFFAGSIIKENAIEVLKVEAKNLTSDLSDELTAEFQEEIEKKLTEEIEKQIEENIIPQITADIEENIIPEIISNIEENIIPKITAEIEKEVAASKNDLVKEIEKVGDDVSNDIESIKSGY